MMPPRLLQIASLSLIVVAVAMLVATARMLLSGSIVAGVVTGTMALATLKGSTDFARLAVFTATEDDRANRG